MYDRFPHQRVGFSYEEWQAIVPAVKRNIRDYFICRKNRVLTQSWCYHETNFAERMIEQKYKLDQRPEIEFSFDTMCFV